VTAAKACNPADLKEETEYILLPDCIKALENTMNSSENCMSKPKCGKGTVDDGKCKYEPIGLVPDKTCDYIDFEKKVATLNKKCSNATFPGSFTYCNNLLKDSYLIALIDTLIDTNCIDYTNETACLTDGDCIWNNWNTDGVCLPAHCNEEGDCPYPYHCMQGICVPYDKHLED